VGGLALIVDWKKLGPSSSPISLEIYHQCLACYTGSGHDFQGSSPGAVVGVIFQMG
jgi:hypothetical protein